MCWSLTPSSPAIRNNAPWSVRYPEPTVRFFSWTSSIRESRLISGLLRRTSVTRASKSYICGHFFLPRVHFCYRGFHHIKTLLELLSCDVQRRNHPQGVPSRGYQNQPVLEACRRDCLRLAHSTFLALLALHDLHAYEEPLPPDISDDLVAPLHLLKPLHSDTSHLHG